METLYRGGKGDFVNGEKGGGDTLGFPVRKCIWLCFGYVIEFLMLIREMVFVFHKSNQTYKRVTLTQLSTTINRMEVSFCSNERFRSAVGYRADSIQDARFRPNYFRP